ncbi:hypothetical protein THAOC_19761 [Thalassiosira oceanica]|uniref:Uncharacterized protein n=1 Tax=Thalassiosira oceanica TaxID=159749 RepID=K0SNC7_THAOC|nr:hypothetical protein THAOC_19761 [Thalassiosira oceanica]|eukprot:EJK59962.1 hypothetical protein THAOC_19761 [Thalassiosira oceanica]
MFAFARTVARRVPTGRAAAANLNRTSKRTMGGGSHWLEVSQPHHYLGEACGFLTWMWIFYRAKQDLPVVLGWRHPWEHAEDPWKIVDHVDDLEGLEKSWDEFADKSTRPGEDDDDDDDDDVRQD